MRRVLASAVCFALMGASAPQVSVETATGDWSKLHRLNQNSDEHLDMIVMARLYQIAAQHQCNLAGFSYDSGGRAHNRLDFGVSFAAQFDPNGTLRRIVIPKLNCPEAEGIVGGALLRMIEAGDYRPTGKSEDDGWYRGDFGFGYGGLN